MNVCLHVCTLAHTLDDLLSQFGQSIRASSLVVLHLGSNAYRYESGTSSLMTPPCVSLGSVRRHTKKNSSSAACTFPVLCNRRRAVPPMSLLRYTAYPLQLFKYRAVPHASSPRQSSLSGSTEQYSRPDGSAGQSALSRNSNSPHRFVVVVVVVVVLNTTVLRYTACSPQFFKSSFVPHLPSPKQSSPGGATKQFSRPDGWAGQSAESMATTSPHER